MPLHLPAPWRHRLLALGLGLAAWSVHAQAPAPTPETDRQDYSAAERLLLMSKQLDGLKPPTQLRYRFQKTGSQEPGFSDDVDLQLQRDAKGGCCKVTSNFLSGARRLSLPEIEQAEGNPVILYFLEHDIREMNRLTKGSSAYFRKRIRMALYQAATVTDTVVSYQGKRLPAQEIRIQPYLDDPNQARFQQYTGKQYVFVLAPALPGRVAWIRSLAPASGGQPPLIQETLNLQGIDPDAAAGPGPKATAPA